MMPRALGLDRASVTVPDAPGTDDAPDWIVACAAWALARLSHLDEIEFDLLPADGGPARTMVLAVASDDTVAAVHRRVVERTPVGAGRIEHVRDHARWQLAIADEQAAPTPGSGEPVGTLRIVAALACRRCVRLGADFDPRQHSSGWIDVVLAQIARLLRTDRSRAGDAGWQWLDPAQHRLVVHGWNDTATDTPIEQCLHALFEAQVRRTPEAVAAEFEGQTISYRALDTMARRIAAQLRRRGAGPGSLVPLCAERSIGLLAGVLAVLKCGAAYVPFEPALPPQQWSQMLEDCMPRVALAQRAFAARLAAAGLEPVIVEHAAEAAEAADDEGPAAHYAGATACVMYTSGSTGRAKGTLIDHRSLVNNILWLQRHWPLHGGDRLLQKTPFGFDVSIKELLWPLAAGARVVLARPGGQVDLRYLARTILEREVSVCHFVPSMLQRFLDALGDERRSSLRLVMCGAEILPPHLQQRFHRQLDATLLHLYGPTEAAISVTGWPCRPEDAQAPVVPLGRPMDNVRLYVLDRAGVPVPPQVPGEIVIGGVAVAQGYLKRPAQQHERFVPDRFAPARPDARLYRTGDLARWRDDGILQFIGRADRQVKIGGARVELREVEVAVQAHPAVKWVAACAAPDALGHLRIRAHVVPMASSQLTPQALHAFCASRLPAFMVPTAFVLVDALPLLHTGKVDYRALQGAMP